MTQITTWYSPGRYGLGTEFAESEIPIEFIQRFENRFINVNGDAEKRQGIRQKGDSISGLPTITGLHEFVANNGTSTIFASANGTIWKLNETTGVWTQVLTGKSASARLNSVRFGDKLCFWNGVDRNFYTDDAGLTFQDLEALIVRGQAATPTSATGTYDSNVTNWLTQTFVNRNDLVYNQTIGAYGIVTSVGANVVQHTSIGSAATGLGHPIISASADHVAGDLYRIIDLIELNIIDQNNGFDNFALSTGDTSAAGIFVSGVDWTRVPIREGDYVYNTTRSAVAKVSAITTSQITTTPIAGQTANDSIQFFKSAMPTATWMHVHYGRAYYIDERDQGLVRITGVGDPQDLTTFQRTLTSNAVNYGARQPQSERLLCLKTFQKYLVGEGERNVYADRGIDPIQDTTAAAVDFSPVGLFPQGGISPYGIESIGGSMTFVSNDGLRNFTAAFDSEAFQTSNLSEYIKKELSAEIASKSNDPNEIQAIHYPRRNWLMVKVGDVIYNYNYSPYFYNGTTLTQQIGSWSKFTGKIAEQKVFLLRRNGDLLCAGAGGKVYEFDKGQYSDDGNLISTVYESGWLTLAEPQKSTQIKTGVYIKPKFESGAAIDYTITATGDYDERSIDTASVRTVGVGQIGFAQIGSSQIGGQRITETKKPLRWKGENFKIRIETNTTSGPDIITGFTIYGNILGKM